MEDQHPTQWGQDIGSVTIGDVHAMVKRPKDRGAAARQDTEGARILDDL